VVDSDGWELSINWNDKIGQDFRYWAKVNISENNNEVKEMKEAPMNNVYQYQKGHRIGARSQYLFWKFYEGEQTKTEYEQTFGSPWPDQLTGELQPGAACLSTSTRTARSTNDMSATLAIPRPPVMAGLTLLCLETPYFNANSQPHECESYAQDGSADNSSAPGQ
jgi:hypothetical protein